MQATFELVSSLAHNPHAHDPGFAPVVAQAHEAGEMVAWLHSSAAARLSPTAAVEMVSSHESSGASLGTLGGASADIT